MSSDFADSQIPASNARWSFSGPCAEGFDSHVARSVPLYRSAHDVVLNLSDFLVHPNSRIYDIGCATGQLTAKLAERHIAKTPLIVAIDSEADMIAAAQSACAPYPNIDLLHQSVVDFPFQSNDLVVSFYTIQFVLPKHRQAVITSIYNSLNWGGGLLLFEKVRAPDARFQDMMTTVYHDWKQHMGFLPEEILAKMNSLKGVLEPFSTQGNLDLLRRAGFVDVMTVFKFLNFEGFLAIK